jgi:serine protease
VEDLRKPSFRLLALMALALAPCFGYAAATRVESTDRLIIRWRAAPQDAQAETREALRLGERTGQVVSRSQRIGGRLSVLQLDRARSGEELKAMLSALRADPDVELVEPDRRVHAHAYAASDPLFAGQWYLKSVEASAIRADAAWDITRGGASPATSTVVVAVLDTGVRFEHPDLTAKLLPGYDFVSADSSRVFATANDGNGWDSNAEDPGDFLTATDLVTPPFKGQECGDQASDSSWHGTRVSGMIAADTDNALGIAGTAFNVRILPVRVLGKCGGQDSDVIAGMYWAAGLPLPQVPNGQVVPVNANPAQVINMSLGGAGPCSPVYAAAVQEITARGVLIVVSAGNDGEAVASPANCAGALGVLGLRHIGTKVGFSDLGPEIGIGAPGGNCVNITAGSPCLFSLDTTTNDGAQAPGNSAYTNQLNSNVGTSFAAPQVAGAAGLMKAVNPALTPALLIARMRATARPFATSSDSIPTPPVCQLPATGLVQITECICTTTVCGAGMLDVGAAVGDAQRPVAVAKLTGTVAVGRILTLDGSQSAAAAGRALTVYSWTVISTSGGAATPLIQNASQPIATVVSPASGSYTLRLTITDNLTATDHVDVMVVADNSGGGGSGSGGSGSGGGGGTAPGLLLVAALMSLARLIRGKGAQC